MAHNRPKRSQTSLSRAPASNSSSTVRSPESRVAAATTATEHLIERGHTAIGFLGGLAHHDLADSRLAGFRATMERHGLAVDPTFVTQLGLTPVDGQAAFAQVIALPRRPTALVVANVNAAVGVLLAARTLEIAIPDTMSVVTIHDSQAAEFARPRLTAVKLPLHATGHEAIVQLHRHLGGTAVTRVVVSDPAPRLIERDSVRPPR